MHIDMLFVVISLSRSMRPQENPPASYLDLQKSYGPKVRHPGPFLALCIELFSLCYCLWACRIVNCSPYLTLNFWWYLRYNHTRARAWLPACLEIYRSVLYSCLPGHYLIAENNWVESLTSFFLFSFWKRPTASTGTEFIFTLSMQMACLDNHNSSHVCCPF